MKKCCLLISLAISFCADAQQQHAATLQQKALTLRRFLEKNHYQPLSWNDSASARLYDKWIGELDEEKLFFTQAEINQLAVFKTKLDEELQGRGWEFFTRSSTLFRLAILRADSLMQAILSKPLDFSKPDNIVWPCADYAANTTELALRWQRLFKWRILEDIADKLTGDGKTLPLQQPADFGKWEKEMREKLKKREGQYIKGMLKTPASFIADREDEYLNSIAWCYDPHTAYMNLKEKKEFETDMSASEYSAGFDLEENEKGDKTIGYLQPGGSAWRSGQLHTGDQVVAVKTDGVEKKVEDMDDDDELERALGGSSQSDLELTVRTTAGETKTVKLTKEKITAEESIVKSYVLRGSRNIGYINLPGFYSRESESIRDERDIKYDGCANDVSKEIVKLKWDSIAGLILDLRYNGGGSMWEAMQLAGIFIDIGPVASVKDREGKLRFLKDPNRGTIYDGPLIVLVNGASASASEFVSAVLQDYNRALIVGGPTYGKGTAQIVLPMDTLTPSRDKTYLDFVKVTEEKFYRVNGSTTQWKGVIPDIELPDAYSDESFKEKANSSALQPDNVRAGIYQQLPVIPVQSLKQKSSQRVQAAPFFTGVSAFGQWLKSYRTGRTIPLQWNAYASHYSKTTEMFKQMKPDETATGSVFTAANNAFDMERIRLSGTRSQEINKTYLLHVQNDQVLREACYILLDWIGN